MKKTTTQNTRGVHRGVKQSNATSLGGPTLVGKALSFTHKLSFSFFFYQSTVVSSHAEDGHQIYFGGSIVGKASTIGSRLPLP